MLELTEYLVGPALKVLLQPTRHYVHGDYVVWVDVKLQPEKFFKGMLYFFNDAMCYTIAETKKKKNKPKQKIVLVMALAACITTWREDTLSVRYDSLRTHIIDFTFQSEKAATVARQLLQEIRANVIKNVQ